MALAPGVRLGPYEIQSALGAGGMGVVYKARDTRLDRTVAIKVLPESLAADPQFRERFDREARTISQLDHPHICALHDVGEQDGTSFLVMQYLEGETLEARLKKGALSLDQALPYAIQIADALDRAHRAGIVHRDLKPSNIMLTKGGARLLDFGLAKTTGAVDAAGVSMLPTTPPNLTAQGTILGTFQYMAPEQLEGHEADARTDIFAFGAVVYEIITGKKAFDGKTQASLITAIMASDPPDMSSLQPLAPRRLDRIVRKSLSKDPDERWQTAKDLKDELSWVSVEGSQLEGAPGPAMATVPRARRREMLAWASLVVVLAALAATVAWGRGGYFRPAETAPLYRSSVLLPEGINPSPALSAAARLALSPDGRWLALSASPGSLGVSQRQLWLRALNGVTAQPLAGTEGAGAPFWSPDSNSIAFIAQGKLKRISTTGGPVIALADAGVVATGAWNRNDVILFTPARGPLQRISASGGTVSPVTTLDTSKGDVIHTDPVFLPDGRHFLYLSTGVSTGRPAGAIRVASLDPKEPTRELLVVNSNAKYALGYLLFVRERTLMAQPFDADALKLRGQAVPIAEQLDATTTTVFNGGSFTVSDTGVLAYGTGSADIRSQLAWFDRSGRRQTTIGEPADQMNPVLSPDAGRAVVSVLDATKNTRDLWIYDLARGLRTRFTFDPSDEINAVWSPDGTQVVFNSRRTGRLDLYQKASNGSGGETLVATDMQNNLYPTSWSADGRHLLYFSGNSTARTGNDLWLLTMGAGPTSSGQDTTRKGTPFLQTEFNESNATFSPDGRWVAYASTESGRNEVYVTSFPNAAGKWQVSSNGGAYPRWRHDGKELFFTDPANGRLFAAEVSEQTVGFAVGAVKPLFDAQVRTAGFAGAFTPNYDVTADGQRFLVNTVGDSTETIPITLVVNWTAGLEK